ncbi:MAG: hypothetical protein F4123_09760 [Gemmatimonadetes bacterium]|nr:hypothetical protein [Gemmatimonadota bacterium]MYB97668.1 hypothetical protein [Gemmatimonadota bacterium]MYI46642.1 hypothetical protein [Gemmatimonadota bacterium]
MRYIVLATGCLALAALAAGTLATQERPSELTGCYDITAKDLLTDDLVASGFEQEIPRRIEFAGPSRGWSHRDSLRTAIVVPEGALPSVHHLMSGEIIGDSLNVGFSTGYGGVTAMLGWTGERWVGVARHFYDVGPPFEEDAGPIELTPASCDSPPPVPVDVMLPITRSVELEGGLVITLGEPLPEVLGPTPERFANRNVTGRTTGLFAGTDSISVGLVEQWGVTQIRLHYTDPDAYSNVETRLRQAYGAPEEDLSGDATHSNPITRLVLIDLANGAGDVLLSFR